MCLFIVNPCYDARYEAGSLRPFCKQEIWDIRTLNPLPGSIELFMTGSQDMTPKLPLFIRMLHCELFTGPCHWTDADLSRAERGPRWSWEALLVLWEKEVSKFQFWGAGKSHQLPEPPLSHLQNGHVTFRHRPAEASRDIMSVQKTGHIGINTVF